jgi:hypothetical protein
MRAHRTWAVLVAALRDSGRTERAYAMTDVTEYFAEFSEAYFGTNDFYPFARAELIRHEPEDGGGAGRGVGRTVSKRRGRIACGTRAHPTRPMAPPCRCIRAPHSLVRG